MFKYSCYIENSKEAITHLELLGYTLEYPTKKEEGWIQTSNNYAFITDSIYRNGVETNCVGNLPLFKALTAVRDDSNINKYFTDDYIFIKSEYEDYKKYIDDYYTLSDCNVDNFREATEKELMEYFKLTT